MKYILGLSLSLLLFIACEPSSPQSQGQKLGLASTQTSSTSTANRISPQQKAAGLIGNTVVKVDYSSPSMKDRIIWGGLVPYGEVWRTGADEATVVSLEKDVLIQGEKLKAGKYSLYTIPTRDKWTIIFNYVWDQWGTEYNENQDALRVEVSPQKANSQKERLEIKVEPNKLLIHWDRLQVPVSIEAAPVEETQDA